MSTVESAHQSAEALGWVASQSVSDGLRGITRELRAAAAALADEDEGAAARQRALAILRSVDASLLSLACAPTTPARAATVLVRLRDDLSGSLLAAVLVAESGTKAPHAASEILRRAIASASLTLIEMSQRDRDDDQRWATA